MSEPDSTDTATDSMAAGEHRPLLIVLHGYDDPPSRAGELAERLDPDHRYRHLAPSGPVSVDSSSDRRAWFGLDEVATGRVDPGSARDSIVAAVGGVDAGGGRRLSAVVVGVSQGAACAAALCGGGLWRAPLPELTGLVLFSGFVVETEGRNPVVAATLDGVQVWSDAGTADDVVPDFFTDGLDHWLTSLGADVRTRRTDRGHALDPDSEGAASRWISGLMSTRQPSGTTPI